MWGNRLGWGISAVIVVCACFLGYAIYQAGLPTPPTGWVARAVHPLVLPAQTNQIVPGMTKACDAGDLYRKAIADYQSSPDFYDSLAAVSNFNAAAVARRPGVQAVLEAADCSTMKLFQSVPQEIVNYKPERAPLEAIYKVGKAAALVALYSDDPATKQKYYAAVFSLGRKLYQERVVYDELSKGEDLMGTGVGGLKSLAAKAKQTDRVNMLKEFESNRLEEYKNNIEPVWTVISSIGDNLIAIHAGDMFALAADKSADQLWRVEAILKIGRLKYNANRRGDQLLAPIFLRQLSEDSMEPPAVRAAATQALDLTIEGYRQLR